MKMDLRFVFVVIGVVNLLVTGGAWAADEVLRPIITVNSVGQKVDGVSSPELPDVPAAVRQEPLKVAPVQVLPQKNDTLAVSAPVASVDMKTLKIPGELNFRETDIRTVLSILAEKSGVAIEVREGISGAVTLGLKDMLLVDVLKIVLDPGGMGFVAEEGKIRVLSKADTSRRPADEFWPLLHVRVIPLNYLPPQAAVDELKLKGLLVGRAWADQRLPVVYVLDTNENLYKISDYLSKKDLPPLKTEIFSLNYAVAEKVVVPLADVLTKNFGTVKFDTQNNSLVVTDTVDKIKQVAELLKRLDQKVEVLLNVAVYKVRLNEEHQDGIDWEAIVTGFQRQDILATEKTGPGEPNRLSLGTLTEDDYEVLIEALETVGAVTLVSEIQVTAVMGKTAEIPLDVAGDVPAVAGGKSGAQKPTAQGFLCPLSVRPFLDGEKKLTLELDPRLTWREAGAVAGLAERWKDFSPRAKSQVLLGDNGVLVIGGLLREKEIQKISKWPLLGDLPIFGFVFRHQNRLIERTEYIIAVVPQFNVEKNSPAAGASQ